MACGGKILELGKECRGRRRWLMVQESRGLKKVKAEEEACAL